MTTKCKTTGYEDCAWADSILQLAAVLGVSPDQLIRTCMLPTPALTMDACRELAKTNPYSADDLFRLFCFEREVGPYCFAASIASLAAVAAERSISLRK